jgi:TPR repeat protein
MGESREGPKAGASVALAKPHKPIDVERSAQAERLLTQGGQFLAQGNIVVARHYFLRAAEAANAKGALRLGETYDAHELARLGVVGVKPEPTQAQKWYERALELGSPEAVAKLQRLAGQ